MHIAVDGSFWGGQERGVAAATRRLWSAYLKRIPRQQVTVFAPESLEAGMPGGTIIPTGPMHGATRVLWQQLVLPQRVRDLSIDLLHCPCYTAPLAASCRMLVTVHDLIALTHPRLAGWRNSLHLRLLVGQSVRRADAVCVPTEFVRRALVERFAIPAAKVFVVPWGVDAELTPMSRDVATYHVRRRFGVDEPFVLYCGCIEAKKNLGAAMEACAEAGILLLMAGPSTSGSAELLARASCSRGGWRYLGYVPVSDLSALYSAAIALVSPSHVEGFGIPAVEAMQCGCPVIASDDPALREVCGGAAVHVACCDPSVLAAALQSVATDRTLREELTARGLARAAHFSWETAAGRFAEALRYVGSQSCYAVPAIRYGVST